MDQIVFAEYTEANRQAVKSWVDGNSEAYDWTPLIELVVLELEAKNADCPAANKDKDKLESVAHRASEIKRKSNLSYHVMLPKTR